MRYRRLGRTGINVSAIAFGAGPVSGLMTGADFDAQLDTVAAALEAGINWFDTAPGYGSGTSETNLGRVLEELRADDSIHVATKVRVPADVVNVAVFVHRSIEESLVRLRRSNVSLVQLHNGLTHRAGDEPASLSGDDVLRNGGVADALDKLRDAGLVRLIGLTGTGHAEALRAVVRSDRFDSLQVPFNRLNPSAGSFDPPSAGDPDYGNIIADCVARRMGVFAIRVFAGGALLGQPPSAHTLKTPYFPIAQYERDAARAEELRDGGPNEAIRFALDHPGVSSALIGFGSPDQVASAARHFFAPRPSPL